MNEDDYPIIDPTFSSIKDGEKVNHIKEEHLDYTTWIDKANREHLSGAIGKDRYVTLVTQPNYRIKIENGDYEAVEVKGVK